MFTWFADCHEVWHAGDFGSMDVLEALRAFKPVRGVYGNVDGSELQSQLPLTLTWQLAGISVYMTHIGGHPGRYDRSAKKDLLRLRPDVFVCGHSHILRVARDAALGVLYLNPGASGHQGWHTVRTLLRFSIGERGVQDVEAIELGPRGRRKPADD